MTILHGTTFDGCVELDVPFDTTSRTIRMIKATDAVRDIQVHVPFKMCNPLFDVNTIRDFF